MLGEVIGDQTVASRQLAVYSDKVYKAVTNCFKITNYTRSYGTWLKAT